MTWQCWLKKRDLNILMRKLDETCGKYGMKINMGKTKVMKMGWSKGEPMDIVVGASRVKQVKKFRYLGSLVNEEGCCSDEIRGRIAMAKVAFNKRKRILCGPLNRSLKKRLVKSMVWSVAVYGAETWTLKKVDRNRLEAFEMWAWRRMEKISWTRKMSNMNDVLALIGEERSLMRRVRGMKRNWVGHVLRENGLMGSVLEGVVMGKRGRGRRRRGFMDCMVEGDGYVGVKRRAEDRVSWRNS